MRRKPRDLFARDLDQRMRFERARHFAREAVPVDGERAACGQLVRVGGLHNQRAHTAHLLVQQANRVGLDIVRTEGVGADKLGESSGLVRLGQARGPHLVQHH